MTCTIFNCPLLTFSKKWNTGILAYLVIEELGQVAKLKRTCKLAPVSKIVQKITENFCICLYLSTGQVWWLHDLWFKRCLVNHGMVKNKKTWISWERNIIILQNKKIPNLCFRWYILRSYRFIAEVTFKWLVNFRWMISYFQMNESLAARPDIYWHKESNRCIY